MGERQVYCRSSSSVIVSSSIRSSISDSSRSLNQDLSCTLSLGVESRGREAEVGDLTERWVYVGQVSDNDTQTSGRALELQKVPKGPGKDSEIQQMPVSIVAVVGREERCAETTSHSNSG